ncbi:peptidylprolyl isomerase [Paenibacillus sp. D51F]
MADKDKDPKDHLDPVDPKQDEHLTMEDTATNEGVEFAGRSGDEHREETLQAEDIVEEERAEESLRQAENDAEIHTADPERAFGSVPVTEGSVVNTSAGAADLPLTDGNGSGPRRSGAATGWMIASLVLAVALVIALVSLFNGNGGAASGGTVASVNGEKISKDELYEAMVPSAGTTALDSLITMKLVDQEASNKKIEVTEDEMAKELADVKKNFGSESAFVDALKQAGLSEDVLNNQLQMQVQLRKLLKDKVKVTDADIQKYYDENKASFATEEQVKASHILVKTKEEADAIEKQLKDGGDFAAIAKEKSTDTGSAANGGDLGYFGKGAMVPEFEKAAFDLKVGEISAPIKSDYGYHIIKVIDHKQASTPTLEEKKAEITETLEYQQLGTLSQTLITDLRGKATITNSFEENAAAKAAENSAGAENAAANNS